MLSTQEKPERGQRFEPLEERTTYLLSLPARVPKGSISACRISVIKRDYVTFYYSTELPWPSRLIPGPIMLYPKLETSLIEEKPTI